MFILLKSLEIINSEGARRESEKAKHSSGYLHLPKQGRTGGGFFIACSRDHSLLYLRHKSSWRTGTFSATPDPTTLHVNMQINLTTHTARKASQRH